MGADFTYSLCPKEVDKETAINRVMSLTDAELLQIAENCGEEYLLEEDNSTALSDYRDIIIADLYAVYGDTRDTAELRVEGKTFVLTGGMSWGDEPTDSYCSLLRLSESYVTDTEETWVKMHNYREQLEEI